MALPTRYSVDAMLSSTLDDIINTSTKHYKKSGINPTTGVGVNKNTNKNFKNNSTSGTPHAGTGQKRRFSSTAHTGSVMANAVMKGSSPVHRTRNAKRFKFDGAVSMGSDTAGTHNNRSAASAARNTPARRLSNTGGGMSPAGTLSRPPKLHRAVPLEAKLAMALDDINPPPLSNITTKHNNKSTTYAAEQRLLWILQQPLSESNRTPPVPKTNTGTKSAAKSLPRVGLNNIIATARTKKAKSQNSIKQLSAGIASTGYQRRLGQSSAGGKQLPVGGTGRKIKKHIAAAAHLSALRGAAAGSNPNSALARRRQNAVYRQTITLRTGAINAKRGVAVKRDMFVKTGTGIDGRTQRSKPSAGNRYEDGTLDGTGSTGRHVLQDYRRPGARSSPTLGGRITGNRKVEEQWAAPRGAYTIDEDVIATRLLFGNKVGTTGSTSVTGGITRRPNNESTGARAYGRREATGVSRQRYTDSDCGDGVVHYDTVGGLGGRALWREDRYGSVEYYDPQEGRGRTHGHVVPVTNHSPYNQGSTLRSFDGLSHTITRRRNTESYMDDSASPPPKSIHSSHGGHPRHLSISGASVVVLPPSAAVRIPAANSYHQQPHYHIVDDDARLVDESRPSTTDTLTGTRQGAAHNNTLYTGTPNRTTGSTNPLHANSTGSTVNNSAGFHFSSEDITLMSQMRIVAQLTEVPSEVIEAIKMGPIPTQHQQNRNSTTGATGGIAAAPTTAPPPVRSIPQSGNSPPAGTTGGAVSSSADSHNFQQQYYSGRRSRGADTANNGYHHAAANHQQSSPIVSSSQYYHRQQRGVHHSTIATTNSPRLHYNHHAAQHRTSSATTGSQQQYTTTAATMGAVGGKVGGHYNSSTNYPHHHMHTRPHHQQHNLAATPAQTSAPAGRRPSSDRREGLRAAAAELVQEVRGNSSNTIHGDYNVTTDGCAARGGVRASVAHQDGDYAWHVRNRDAWS